MRSWKEYKSPFLKGLISESDKKSMLILLHGVGANERGLPQIGEVLLEEGVLVSLRAPLEFSSSSFGWFHVEFTANGPVHNWREAKESFELLEKEIRYLSKTYHIPIEKISVMGFSQGSIMAMGLALQSELNLGSYLCFSGRTLPEFAEYGHSHKELSKGRRIFLAHGKLDDKLPVQLGQRSEHLLRELGADYIYNEFLGGHEIQFDVLSEAKKYLEHKDKKE